MEALYGQGFDALREAATGHKPMPMSDAARAELDKWVDRHAMRRRGKLPQRSLIYVCHKEGGGLADRQKGMVTAFWMSFLLDRAVYLDYTLPVDLETVYEPNRVNWVKPGGLRVHELKSLIGARSAAVSWFVRVASTNPDTNLAFAGNHMLQPLMLALSRVKSVRKSPQWAVLQELRWSVQVQSVAGVVDCADLT